MVLGRLGRGPENSRLDFGGYLSRVPESGSRSDPGIFLKQFFIYTIVIPIQSLE